MQQTNSTLLTSLTKKIVGTSDKGQLLKEMDEYVMPLFEGIEGMGLYIINKEENYHYDLTVQHPSLDGGDSNMQIPIIDPAFKTTHAGTLVEHHFNALIAKQAPLIFDLSADYKSYPSPYSKEMLTAGYKQTYAALLQTGNDAFGICYLYSSQQTVLQTIDAELFQHVTDLIAIALSNILTKEAILEREQEKTLLLKISEAIASVQNSKQLFKVIYEEIKPILHYEAAGLFIINKTGDSIYEFTDSEILQDQAQKEITDKGLLGPFKLSEFSEAFWIFNETPFITSISEQSKYVNDPISKQQFEIGMAHGLNEMIAGPLFCGGKKIGMLCFVVKQQSYYQQKHLAFFKSISDLIAVSVANIIVNEEILEKEKEKALLLSVGNAIAKIDNKVDLLHCIDRMLHPIFMHDDAFFSIVSEDKQSFIDYYFLYAKHTAGKDLPENCDMINRRGFDISDNARLPYANSVVAYSMNRTTEAGKLEDLLPLHLNHNYPKREMEAGLVYYLCCPLKVAGKTIGVFGLLFKENNKPAVKMLELFAQISDRMALAFSNILSAEEITEREMVKTKQLEILETLNQSNGWNDKFMAVAKKFDEFVGCDSFSYSIRLKDGKKMGKGFMKQPETGLFSPKSLQEYLSDMHVTELEYRELYNEAMSFFEGSKYYCGSDLLQAAEQTRLLKKSIEAYHTHSVMFAEKSFPKGSILFTLCSVNEQQYNSKTLQFLEASAQQMTLSVMNILDNEEVLERERQKTLEIEVNNAVLANEDFGNVMRGISESIGKTIGCDICYIRVMSGEIDPKPFHLFCEYVDGKYTVRSVDDKVADTGISAAQSARNAEEFLITIKEPTILSGLELETRTPGYPYLQIFTSKIGIKSFIFLPLQLKYSCIAYLIIGSRTAYAYIDSDLETISNIKTQLSLALDNRLAFYQIQRLKEMLETENLYLQEAINENYNFNEMVGSSPALQAVFMQASMVATTDTTVLISGETGTGKELIARAIHNLSHRKDKIMVKVNCACLPAQLIESELFGHEKGAFTGAMEKRIGKFELANGGTIFLDEIGELPLELQAKLLRVIQEREFERIGGRTVLKTDIRIIAATNKNLEVESSEKRFRSDLYYRLNVFPIQLPALRERREDIPLLALHFAKKFGQKMRKNIAAITNEALQEMMHYEWPGNIRELEHVVEHSVISSKSSKLSLARPLLTDKTSPAKSLTEFRIKTLNDNEREHILSILKYSNGKIRGNGGAAQLLDIHPNTLESRMQKLGIKKEHVLL
jgi:formate hydrogenlyase transcriptional activator